MKMRGSQRGNLSIEIGVVMVLAIMWWSSMTITPSSAQQDSSEPGTCWVTIGKCIQSHINDTTNPKFNLSSPSFDPSEFACCPMIKQTFETDKPCFCTISPLYQQDPANFTALFKLCDTTSTEAEFHALCPGSTPPPAEAPMAKLPLGDLPSVIFGLKN